MARIVIVTPGQLGMNPRAVKEADALAAAGHEVHVIAAHLSARLEARSLDAAAGALWTREAVRLDTAVRRWPARLAQEGAKHLRRALPAALPAAPLDALAASPVAPGLAAAARARPADLYIAHYVAALPAAAAAARAHGAAYAYDAEDFHPGDLPEGPRHDVARALITAIEGRHLPGAAYVTAASPGIADALAERYGIARPQVVLNAFARAEGPPAPRAAGSARAEPSLYWFSQTRGPDRGLECALEAAAMARTRPHLHLRGEGAAGFDEMLRRRARALGCPHRLHLHPPALPSRMALLAAGHDAGLVAETGGTLNRRIALTNKQFTYLTAGIPAVMSDVPAHRDFARRAPGAAILYKAGDPASLAMALDEILGDPARLARARRAAHALGQGPFCWEAEAPGLVARAEAALGARRAAPRPRALRLAAVR